MTMQVTRNSVGNDDALFDSTMISADDSEVQMHSGVTYI
jgi:hypothetical protein